MAERRRMFSDVLHDTLLYLAPVTPDPDANLMDVIQEQNRRIIIAHYFFCYAMAKKESRKSKMLRIFGVKHNPERSTLEVLLDFFHTEMNTVVPASAILFCSRCLPDNPASNKPRAIVVKFREDDFSEQIWLLYKSLRSHVELNFYICKELVLVGEEGMLIMAAIKEFGMLNVFPLDIGIFLFKFEDGSQRYFSNFEEFFNILEERKRMMTAQPTP